MQVRICDVIRFCDYRIEYFEKRKLELEQKFQKEKEEFENMFFAKLFRMKYEMSWDDSWCYSWDYAKKYKDLLAECEYYSKLYSHEYLINLPEELKSLFFNYCKENKIPY